MFALGVPYEVEAVELEEMYEVVDCALVNACHSQL